MLLAALFAVPLWLTLPAYFGIGFLWAIAYLPHAVAKQARRYTDWRDGIAAGRITTGRLRDDAFPGRTLEDAFKAEVKKGHQALTAALFRKIRDKEDFTERKIIVGFIFDIAFWPLRILYRFVFEFLKKVLKKLWHYLKRFWELLEKLCKWLRDIWNNFIVPVYQWIYQRFVNVYRLIIQRANREAIADMAVLDGIQKEGK